MNPQTVSMRRMVIQQPVTRFWRIRGDKVETNPMNYAKPRPARGEPLEDAVKVVNPMNKALTTVVVKAPPPNKTVPQFIPPTIAKMEWGKHVWYFIHSLTVLVKEEEFLSIKTELLNMLYLLCTNLPCPICSDHAKIYLKSINFNAIQTKEQLKNLFYQFHNYVNSKKQLPIFQREKLEEIYSSAILQNIFTNFQIAFRDKSYNPRHISDQHIRIRVLKMFSEWFLKNRNAFGVTA